MFLPYICLSGVRTAHNWGIASEQLLQVLTVVDLSLGPSRRSTYEGLHWHPYIHHAYC
jgi:hypothetical protein